MTDFAEFVRTPRAFTFGLLLVAILVNTTGETLLKHGMNGIGELHFDIPALIRTFSAPPVFIGFTFVFAAAILWLKVISRADLSWAYPMLAMSNVIILIGSRFFLGEHISWQRVTGTLVILSGVLILYGTGRE